MSWENEMVFKLFNTMSGKLEVFRPLENKRVNMYVCGLTPYDYSHLGHARAAVVFDVLRRYLENKGYKVRHITNFTDIDDKIIRKSNQENMPVSEIVERFSHEYLKNLDKMKVKRAHVYARVTQIIPEIIEMISSLIDKGYAYFVDGNVYYNVSKFEKYGKLSHQTVEKMKAGERLEVDERKKAPADFALWKGAKEGEPSWKSPWGNGRPGWHIECSAIVRKYFGDSIDIHGGGLDLIFPHHENEIAQSEAVTGKMLAKYWVHNGLVIVQNEKMSKSLRNYFALKDALRIYSPEVIRYFLLSSHYRSPLEFEEKYLKQAESSVSRLRNTLYNLIIKLKNGEFETTQKISNREVRLQKIIELYKNKFQKSLDDDLNVPRALSYIFEFTKITNKEIDFIQNQQVLEKVIKTYREFGAILGLFENMEEVNPPLTEEIIIELIQKRNEARENKKWELADKIRDELKQKGIILEDTPKGTKWKVKI